MKKQIITTVIKAFTYWKDVRDTLEVPKCPGYSFSHWSLEIDSEAIPEEHQFLEDTTIYACYEVVYIRIDLELRGGECKIDHLLVPQLTEFREVRDQLREYTVHNPGFSLDYWSLEPENGTEIKLSHVFEESTTIYAYYTDDFISVVFDPMGGEVVGFNTLRVNRYTTWQELKEMVPSAELVGYEFRHWTRDADTDAQIEDSYQFQEDIVTLYAVYERIIVYVDVIFDYDDFTETVNIATGSTLQQAIDQLDGWNKGSGYKLLGWGFSKMSQVALDPITTIIMSPQTFYACYERTFELYLITNSTLTQLYSIPTTHIGTVVLKNGENLMAVFGDSAFRSAMKQDYIALQGQICNSSGTPITVTNDLAPGSYYVKYHSPGETELTFLVPCVGAPSMTSYEYLADSATTWAIGTCKLPFVVTPSLVKSRIQSAISSALSGTDEISGSELNSNYDVLGICLYSGDMQNARNTNLPSRYFSLSGSSNYLATAFQNGKTIMVAVRYRSTILLNQAPGENKLRGSNFEFPYCTLRIARSAIVAAAQAGSSGRLYSKMDNTDYDDREDEEEVSFPSTDIESDGNITWFPTLGAEQMRGFAFRAPS